MLRETYLKSVCCVIKYNLTSYLTTFLIYAGSFSYKDTAVLTQFYKLRLTNCFNGNQQKYELSIVHYREQILRRDFKC